MIPINLGLHWSCALVVFDDGVESGRILLLDSFNESSAHPHDRFAEAIRCYLNHEKRELASGKPRIKRARKQKRRTKEVRIAKTDIYTDKNDC